MSLSGVEFFWFLPAVLLVHWLLPRRAGLQNAALLLASAVFYASWNVRLLPLLGAAIALSYGAGRLLQPADGEVPAASRRRRWILAAALAAQLGLLGVFKYAGFFTASLADLLAALGLPDALPVLRLALPLGISYTTLIQVGYLLDVYHGRAPACRDPAAYGLFVGFFPQLLAGPIVRTAAMLPQYLAPRLPDPALLARGAAAFLTGAALKGYAADWLARWIVDPVFADPGRFGAGALWLGLLGYALQIFCDFAGYSLLAIGTGNLLGLSLPPNFRFPFLSTSLGEFWRRWHMSLNLWLFDHLFVPLTTSRTWFRGRVAAGFLVVFLVSGLWHGATWTFVLWGLVHGVALAVHARYDAFYKGLCRRDRRWVARRRSGPYLAVAWLATQSVFVLSLVPFRCDSLEGAATYARGLLGLGGDAAHGQAGAFHLWAIVVLLAAWHLVEEGPLAGLKARFLALPAPVRGLGYGLAVLWLLLFTPVGASTPIYGRF